jgi:hypothetical protein
LLEQRSVELRIAMPSEMKVGDVQEASRHGRSRLYSEACG